VSRLSSYFALGIIPLAVLAAVVVAPTVARSGTSHGAARLVGDTFRFDMTQGSVKGHSMLGETYSAVTNVLGRPQHRSLERRYGVIRYGTLKRGAWPLSIYFKRRAGRLRAWSVAIASTRASEVRLGRILRLQPRVIQAKIADTYAGKLRLTEPYRCRRKPLRCHGEFRQEGGDVEVAFGLLRPGASSGRYINIYET
jgi:hypothetical protein